MPDGACPCGSQKGYPVCCGRYVDQSYIAPTAQALMRSRYTAYTLNHDRYLLATWHHSTRPMTLELGDPLPRWLGLSVVRCVRGTVADHGGVVEFIARYTHDGRSHQLHEVSRFCREHGQWFYLDGEAGRRVEGCQKSAAKNAKCSCGSGKKYKRCCGSGPS